jgi:spermidine synthase
VTRVVTCEINPQVIEANKKRYGRLWGDVILCDFYKFQSRKKFDCIVGDIWVDIMPEYFRDYLAFCKKAQSLLKDGGKILGWGQDYFEYKLETGKR